jgi:hypothetical protein
MQRIAICSKSLTENTHTHIDAVDVKESKLYDVNFEPMDLKGHVMFCTIKLSLVPREILGSKVQGFFID